MLAVGEAIAAVRVRQNRGCTFADIHSLPVLPILQNQTAIGWFSQLKPNFIAANTTPELKI